MARSACGFAREHEIDAARLQIHPDDPDLHPSGKTELLPCAVAEQPVLGGVEMEIVLTELGDGPRADVSHAFGQRVTQALCARLPADLASRLRVRAYHHAEPERPQARSGLRSVLDPDMPLAAGLS